MCQPCGLKPAVGECAITAKVPDTAETVMPQQQGFSLDYGGSVACETHEGVSAAKKERPLLFGNGRWPVLQTCVRGRCAATIISDAGGR
jgi:hypothetical protein